MENIIKVLKTIGHIIAAMLILIAAQLISSVIGGFLPYPWIGEIISAVLYISIALTTGLIYVKYVLHISSKELGVKKSLPELKWILIGILLPVLVSVFYQVFTKGEIIRNARLTTVYPTVIYAIFTVGISGGIVEEFIFRGVIMKMMEKYWGRLAAVCIPSFLFGLSHLANLSDWHLLDAVLLIVAGTMVGIMFSLIALQSGTIWSSAVVHGLWNIIIIGGLLEIGTSDYGMSINSVWQYKITASSILLTGGQFGIETAAPAVIGYVIVSACALIFMKRKSIKD
ncbi:MAG: type II CAAX endopeptidase family protein [Lachnospiraceae bacterium]|nr:type II CAAX endopeptidase family protein [Lachnospiraceae bacterium]MDD3617528.1 type II CAAX endopeptidase family protein [Lachnospiraceae bacterium]